MFTIPTPAASQVVTVSNDVLDNHVVENNRKRTISNCSPSRLKTSIGETESITSKEEDTHNLDSKARKRVRSDKSQGFDGERRLSISFRNIGTLGKYIQYCGRSGAVVPHNLSGTHTMYNERWKFEIHHDDATLFTKNGTNCVCITWIMTNLTSGNSYSRTETQDEATMRMFQGRTICGKLFQEALARRADQLQEQLPLETNELRIANLKSQIEMLKPKKFFEGQLAFGLRHKLIQDHMKALVNQQSPIAPENPEKVTT